MQRACVATPHRCSACLTNKASHWTPIGPATQNLLRHKLGLLLSTDLEAANLERYIMMFAEELPEEQVHMIQELIMDHIPTLEAGEMVVEEEA
jgi:hypothetical protein